MATDITSPGSVRDLRTRVETTVATATVGATEEMLKRLTERAVTAYAAGHDVPISQVRTMYETAFRAALSGTDIGSESLRRLLEMTSATVVPDAHLTAQHAIMWGLQAGITKRQFSGLLQDVMSIDGGKLLQAADPTRELLGQLSQGTWTEQVRADAATWTTAELGETVKQRVSASGLSWVRWVSRHDAKTRPEHLRADGQTSPVSGRFNVGDDLLRYPGDPTGSAAMTANCRCIVVGAREPDIGL